MPGFSISPAAPFPPQTGEPFPVGIQWQQDGENLGDRAVDTVNLTGGLSATRGSGETANELTIAGEGAGVSTLVLYLTPDSTALFDDASFSDWTGETVVESTDAEWDAADQQINLLRSGTYKVTITGRIDLGVGQFWPHINVADFSSYGPFAQSFYGSRVAEAGNGMLESRHSRVNARDTSSSDYVAMLGFLSTAAANSEQWTDEYIIEVGSAGFFQPRLYANAYINARDTPVRNVSFSATVTVTRVG